VTADRRTDAADPAPPPDHPPVEAASPRRAILLAVFVAACVAVVYFTPLREWATSVGAEKRPAWIDDLRRRADEAGWAGAVAFTLGCGVLVGVGVPRLALAFIGGALYGWIEGAVLSQFGTFLGCWGTFAVGRSLGRKWVQTLVARRFPRAKSLLDFIARHAFEANLVIRLTPVGNAFFTNLLFSVSKVKSRTFLAATFLGTAPETVALALVGSAVKGTEVGPRLVGGFTALAVLSVVTAWWVRRLRRGTEI
jgi:uncharacterized membrane protein YdjX (TVP38/TMEM64 family)